VARERLDRPLSDVLLRFQSELLLHRIHDRALEDILPPGFLCGHIGSMPGRTRIHGVKLQNFQMYGTERNVVEFDKSCSHFFGRIGITKGDDWSAVRDDASIFLSNLVPDEKRLISIVGKIDGDENQSNGSGKSSILDAISWAFYEKVVRDFFDKAETKKSSTTTVVRTINGKPERECYVEVLFSSGKNLYLVRRERRFKSLEEHTGGVYL
jgi:hypothetical protein